MRSVVGVIGTGAMGLGVVQSLTRAGCAVYARDIRAEALAAAVAAGAVACASPAALARECGILIILVVDAIQVDAVLFGTDGALAALDGGALIATGRALLQSPEALPRSQCDGNETTVGRQPARRRL